LGELVIAAYEEIDRDLRRTDRSIAMMAEELGEAHQQLVDAFEVVPEGIALFDAEDRFVMWNRRYAELYDRSGNAIARGVRFEDTLRVGLENDQYPEAVGREEQWLDERLAHHKLEAANHEQRLPGDRWLRIEERRTASGGSVGVRVDITKIKRSEESFRLLFKSNPIPMFVCDATTLSLLAVNEAAVAHYGYARKQLETMTVFDLRHPNDRDEARTLASSGEGNRQSGQIRRHLKADGTQIEVAIYSKPLTYQGVPATLFAAIDVTDRRNAQRMLEEQKRQLNSALQNMSQGLCMFDAEGRVSLFNERFANLMCVTPEFLTGSSIMDLLRRRFEDGNLAGDPEEFCAKVMDDMRDGRQVVRVRETPNGQTLRVSDSPMPGGGWIATVEDITEIRKAEAEIARLARHDPLTGLPNRTLLKDRMTEALGRISRGEQVAVLCLDLDHFKDVNDSLGHPIGDGLLVAVGKRLQECVRDTDTVARIGGDEFAIIELDVHQIADAEMMARRIIDNLSAPYRIDGHEIVIGASVGISVAPIDSIDADQLVRNADMALYRAKADGRGTYRFFEAEMDARAQARRLLELDLRAAITKGEFEPYFQPIYDLATNRIVAFEALLRWHHPTRGLVSPMTFVPLAEETGLIVPIGEWMLRAACEEATKWSEPVRVAINLSPVQFKSRNLVSIVLGALAASRLKPERLELEITESVLLENNENNIKTLHALRNLGVKISMDDFGTGYCSLSYLRSFPFDKIKIDQSFIRDLSSRQDSMAIVRAVTGIGKTLGITTTAEGVETAEQLSFIKAEGCQEVQGFLFSEAVPSEDIHRLLLDSNARRAVA
jgi:diguanylate cyclase (GGDEF)-like protein/PAS domain S-box-containing protein